MRAECAVEGIAAFSPVWSCGKFITFFSTRMYGYAGEILWWGSFWVVEVLVLAMGLLWLTVRTIDGCFDRISDYPWRLPVRAMVVMILAGLLGAGSFVGAVASWVVGIEEDVNGSVGSGTITGILAYTLLLASGLMLIATLAATSLSGWRMRGSASLRAESPRPAPAGIDPWLEARRREEPTPDDPAPMVARVPPGLAPGGWTGGPGDQPGHLSRDPATCPQGHHQIARAPRSSPMSRSMRASGAWGWCPRMIGWSRRPC